MSAAQGLALFIAGVICVALGRIFWPHQGRGR
jgi:hypothetical protein